MCKRTPFPAPKSQTCVKGHNFRPQISKMRKRIPFPAPKCQICVSGHRLRFPNFKMPPETHLWLPDHKGQALSALLIVHTMARTGQAAEIYPLIGTIAKQSPEGLPGTIWAQVVGPRAHSRPAWRHMEQNRCNCLD